MLSHGGWVWFFYNVHQRFGHALKDLQGILQDGTQCDLQVKTCLQVERFNRSILDYLVADVSRLPIHWKVTALIKI